MMQSLLTGTTHLNRLRSGEVELGTAAEDLQLPSELVAAAAIPDGRELSDSSLADSAADAAADKNYHSETGSNNNPSR